jgi:hypothetical protein
MYCKRDPLQPFTFFFLFFYCSPFELHPNEWKVTNCSTQFNFVFIFICPHLSFSVRPSVPSPSFTRSFPFCPFFLPSPYFIHLPLSTFLHSPSFLPSFLASPSFLHLRSFTLLSSFSSSSTVLPSFGSSRVESTRPLKK